MWGKSSTTRSDAGASSHSSRRKTSSSSSSKSKYRPRSDTVGSSSRRHGGAHDAPASRRSGGKRDTRASSDEDDSRRERESQGTSYSTTSNPLTASGYTPSRNDGDQRAASSKTTSRAAPSPSPSLASTAPNQFPDQVPQDFSLPFRPPSSSRFGAAADFYGDQGQSVQHQPGIRSGTPIVTGAEPHLMAASAEPKPPGETGNGAAADFYADSTTIPPPATSISALSGPHSPSQFQKPSTKPSKQSNHHSSSTLPVAASLAGASAAAYAYHEHHQNSTHQETTLQTTQAPHAQPGRKPGAPHSSGQHLSQASVHMGARPSPHPSPASAYAPSVSQSYHDQHYHRGPLGKFVDWWNDHEDVRRFEEYTEYIGVCKYCFDPHSSAKDAPRRHRPTRKRSREFGHRIDKESRYGRPSSPSSSAESDGFGTGAVGAGLTGLGLASAGSHKKRRDFDDYSVRTGQREGLASTQDVRRRTSRTDPYESHSNLAGPSPRHDPPVETTTRRRRRSSSGSRAGYGAALVARAATASAAGLASRDSARQERRSRKDSRPMRPQDSTAQARHSRKKRSSSSSSNSSVGLWAKLFSPKSKKPEKRRRAGIYDNKLPASSTISDLAYGADMPKVPKRTSAKRSDSPMNATRAVAGLGTAAAILAAADSRRDKTHQRNSDVFAVRERRQSSARRQQITSNQHVSRLPTDGSDEVWEDASDSEASTNASSTMAFGDATAASRPSSAVSTASSSDGRDQVWDGHEQLARRRRVSRAGDVPSTLVGPSRKAHDRESVQNPAYPDLGSAVPTSRPPLQAIDPVPVVETPSRTPPRSPAPKLRSQFRDVPLQQPQPVTPVKPPTHDTVRKYEGTPDRWWNTSEYSSTLPAVDRKNASEQPPKLPTDTFVAADPSFESRSTDYKPPARVEEHRRRTRRLSSFETSPNTKHVGPTTDIAFAAGAAGAAGLAAAAFSAKRKSRPRADSSPERGIAPNSENMGPNSLLHQEVDHESVRSDVVAYKEALRQAPDSAGKSAVHAVDSDRSKYEHEDDPKAQRSSPVQPLVQHEIREASNDKPREPDSDEEIFDPNFFKRRRQASQPGVPATEAVEDAPQENDVNTPEVPNDTSAIQDFAVREHSESDIDGEDYVFKAGRVRKRAASGTPLLNLIHPSPPSSYAGSTRDPESRPASPLRNVETSGIKESVDAAEPETSRPRRRVTWSDDLSEIFQAANNRNDQDDHATDAREISDDSKSGRGPQRSPSRPAEPVPSERSYDATSVTDDRAQDLQGGLDHENSGDTQAYQAPNMVQKSRAVDDAPTKPVDEFATRRPAKSISNTPLRNTSSTEQNTEPVMPGAFVVEGQSPEEAIPSAESRTSAESYGALQDLSMSDRRGSTDHPLANAFSSTTEPEPVQAASEWDVSNGRKSKKQNKRDKKNSAAMNLDELDDGPDESKYISESQRPADSPKIDGDFDRQGRENSDRSTLPSNRKDSRSSYSELSDLPSRKESEAFFDSTEGIAKVDTKNLQEEKEEVLGKGTSTKKGKKKQKAKRRSTTKDSSYDTSDDRWPGTQSAQNNDEATGRRSHVPDDQVNTSAIGSNSALLVNQVTEPLQDQPELETVISPEPAKARKGTNEGANVPASEPTASVSSIIGPQIPLPTSRSLDSLAELERENRGTIDEERTEASYMHPESYSDVPEMVRLPDSRSESPYEELTQVNAIATPGSFGVGHGRSPSGEAKRTSIPLRFRAPPASPQTPTDSLLSDHPHSQSSAPSTPTPRRSSRVGRPTSADFKSSHEYRPLYLPSKYHNHPEPDTQEALPSLPSSRTSSIVDGEHSFESAASSLRGSSPRRYPSDIEFDTWHDFGPDPPDAQYLDSQQATPKALPISQGLPDVPHLDFDSSSPIDVPIQRREASEPWDGEAGTASGVEQAGEEFASQHLVLDAFDEDQTSTEGLGLRDSALMQQQVQGPAGSPSLALQALSGPANSATLRSGTADSHSGQQPAEAAPGLPADDAQTTKTEASEHPSDKPYFLGNEDIESESPSRLDKPPLSVGLSASDQGKKARKGKKKKGKPVPLQEVEAQDSAIQSSDSSAFGPSNVASYGAQDAEQDQLSAKPPLTARLASQADPHDDASGDSSTWHAAVTGAAALSTSVAHAHHDNLINTASRDSPSAGDQTDCVGTLSREDGPDHVNIDSHHKNPINVASQDLHAEYSASQGSFTAHTSQSTKSASERDTMTNLVAVSIHENPINMTSKDLHAEQTSMLEDAASHSAVTIDGVTQAVTAADRSALQVAEPSTLEPSTESVVENIVNRSSTVTPSPELAKSTVSERVSTRTSLIGDSGTAPTSTRASAQDDEEQAGTPGKVRNTSKKDKKKKKKKKGSKDIELATSDGNVQTLQTSQSEEGPDSVTAEVDDEGLLANKRLRKTKRATSENSDSNVVSFSEAEAESQATGNREGVAGGDNVDIEQSHLLAPFPKSSVAEAFQDDTEAEGEIGASDREHAETTRGSGEAAVQSSISTDDGGAAKEEEEGIPESLRSQTHADLKEESRSIDMASHGHDDTLPAEPLRASGLDEELVTEEDAQADVSLADHTNAGDTTLPLSKAEKRKTKKDKKKTKQQPRDEAAAQEEQPPQWAANVLVEIAEVPNTDVTVPGIDEDWTAQSKGSKKTKKDKKKSKQQSWEDVAGGEEVPSEKAVENRIEDPEVIGVETTVPELDQAWVTPVKGSKKSKTNKQKSSWQPEAAEEAATLDFGTDSTAQEPVPQSEISSGGPLTDEIEDNSRNDVAAPADDYLDAPTKKSKKSKKKQRFVAFDEPIEPQAALSAESFGPPEVTQSQSEGNTWLEADKIPASSKKSKKDKWKQRQSSSTDETLEASSSNLEGGLDTPATVGGTVTGSEEIVTLADDTTDSRDTTNRSAAFSTLETVSDDVQPQEEDLDFYDAEASHHPASKTYQENHITEESPLRAFTDDAASFATDPELQNALDTQDELDVMNLIRGDRGVSNRTNGTRDTAAEAHPIEQDHDSTQASLAAEDLHRGLVFEAVSKSKAADSRADSPLVESHPLIASEIEQEQSARSSSLVASASDSKHVGSHEAPAAVAETGQNVMASQGEPLNPTTSPLLDHGLTEDNAIEPSGGKQERSLISEEVDPASELATVVESPLTEVELPSGALDETKASSSNVEEPLIADSVSRDHPVSALGLEENAPGNDGLAQSSPTHDDSATSNVGEDDDWPIQVLSKKDKKKAKKARKKSAATVEEKPLTAAQPSTEVSTEEALVEGAAMPAFSDVPPSPRSRKEVKVKENESAESMLADDVPTIQEISQEPVQEEVEPPETEDPEFTTMTKKDKKKLKKTKAKKSTTENDAQQEQAATPEIKEQGGQANKSYETQGLGDESAGLNLGEFASTPADAIVEPEDSKHDLPLSKKEKKKAKKAKKTPNDDFEGPAANETYSSSIEVHQTAELEGKVESREETSLARQIDDDDGDDEWEARQLSKKEKKKSAKRNKQSSGTSMEPEVSAAPSAESEELSHPHLHSALDTPRVSQSSEVEYSPAIPESQRTFIPEESVELDNFVKDGGEGETQRAEVQLAALAPSESRSYAGEPRRQALETEAIHLSSSEPANAISETQDVPTEKAHSLQTTQDLVDDEAWSVGRSKTKDKKSKKAKKKAQKASGRDDDESIDRSAGGDEDRVSQSLPNRTLLAEADGQTLDQVAVTTPTDTAVHEEAVTQSASDQQEGFGADWNAASDNDQYGLPALESAAGTQSTSEGFVTVADVDDPPTVPMNPNTEDMAFDHHTPMNDAAESTVFDVDSEGFNPKGPSALIEHPETGASVATGSHRKRSINAASRDLHPERPATELGTSVPREALKSADVRMSHHEIPINMISREMHAEQPALYESVEREPSLAQRATADLTELVPANDALSSSRKKLKKDKRKSKKKAVLTADDDDDEAVSSMEGRSVQVPEDFDSTKAEHATLDEKPDTTGEAAIPETPRDLDEPTPTTHRSSSTPGKDPDVERERSSPLDKQTVQKLSDQTAESVIKSEPEKQPISPVEDSRSQSPSQLWAANTHFDSDETSEANWQAHRSAGENDVDFAATLAAGLQDTGFDPDIVIDDSQYHKRTTPPASTSASRSRAGNISPEETVGRRKVDGRAWSFSNFESRVVADDAGNQQSHDTSFDDVVTQSMHHAGFDPAAATEANAVGPAGRLARPPRTSDATSDQQRLTCFERQSTRDQSTSHLGYAGSTEGPPNTDEQAIEELSSTSGQTQRKGDKQPELTFVAAAASAATVSAAALSREPNGKSAGKSSKKKSKKGKKYQPLEDEMQESGAAYAIRNTLQEESQAEELQRGDKGASHTQTDQTDPPISRPQTPTDFQVEATVGEAVPREAVRDSGYHGSWPATPETKFGAFDQENRFEPSRPPLPNIPGSPAPDDESARREPSPVESTSKDRTSALFSSPPGVPAGEDSGTKERSRSNATVQDVPLSTPGLEDLEEGHGLEAYGESTRSVGHTSHGSELEPIHEVSTEQLEDEEQNVGVLRASPALPTMRGASKELAADSPRSYTSPNTSEIANTRRRYRRSSSIESTEQMRPPSALSARSRTPGSGISQRSVTPTLRRSNPSSDLGMSYKRGLAQDQISLDSINNKLGDSANVKPFDSYDPLKGAGKDRRQMSSDRGVYEGWGDVQDSPRSPSRPQSVRKRQSMQIIDLESRLEQVMEENSSLRQGGGVSRGSEPGSEQPHARDEQLREKDVEINSIRTSLSMLQQEVTRLSEHNSQLQSAHEQFSSNTDERNAVLEAERDHAHSQWQASARELEQLRNEGGTSRGGMEAAAGMEMSAALNDKNAEIKRLRAELDKATRRIRILQEQILASKSDDSFLNYKDEEYFESACQQLCQHVQAWVLRFSKFSDMRVCRSLAELHDDQIEGRLDNAILDGSDPDIYLADRVLRRDVFMSVVMTLVWEYVFTRYLFGMDREQRQKLKNLEKILSEVGPQVAVAQWRATTLTLLSRRPQFAEQRETDTEAVVHEIYRTLAAVLPPPRNLVNQVREGLHNLIRLAVDLSIDMRTQRPEYMMCPPLRPEYDTNGDLLKTVPFNDGVMNERSGEFDDNQALAERQATVRLVLFPLVVRKGDEKGEGDEEVVISPAQVHVSREIKKKQQRGLVPGASQPNRSSMSMAAPSALGEDVGDMV